MYYLKKNDKTLGPFSLEKLQKKVEKGHILPEHLISPDKKNWKEAALIKELFPSGEGEIPSPIPHALETAPAAALDEDAPKKLRVTTPHAPSYPPSATETPDDTLEEEIVAVDEEEKKSLDLPKPISIIWNPVRVSSSWTLLSDAAKSKVLKAGIALMIFSLFFSLCGILIFTGRGDGFEEFVSAFLKCFAISLTFPLSFMVVSTFMSKIFSENGDWSFKENLVLVGMVCFPVSLLVLTVAAVNYFSIFSAGQILALLVGFSIYVFTYAVALIFNVLTRVLEKNVSGTVFVVATILLFASALTGFVFKLLM